MTNLMRALVPCCTALALACGGGEGDARRVADPNATNNPSDSSGVASGAPTDPAGPATTPAGDELASRAAFADLAPLGGSKVSGRVTLAYSPNGGVELRAEVNGLTPGKHGIHVHEWGDCSSPDGNSAGGHFNPGGATHGGPESGASHAGDYGNLEADANGHASYSATVRHARLEKGAAGVVGRAVVVHAGEDDLRSDPAGNSGARIACGVIAWEGGAPEPVTKPAS